MNHTSPLLRAVSTSGSSEHLSGWFQRLQTLSTVVLAALSIHLYLGTPALRIRSYKGPESPGRIMTISGSVGRVFQPCPLIVFVKEGRFAPLSWTNDGTGDSASK